MWKLWIATVRPMTLSILIYSNSTSKATNWRYCRGAKQMFAIGHILQMSASNSAAATLTRAPSCATSSISSAARHMHLARVTAFGHLQALREATKNRSSNSARLVRATAPPSSKTLRRSPRNPAPCHDRNTRRGWPLHPPNLRRASPATLCLQTSAAQCSKH